MKKPNLITREKNFMNTVISISVVQHNESTVKIQEAIDLAFGEFDRIVNKFTRFDENSELSNLNRQSEKWVKVSNEFFDLIKYMLDMAEKTDGAFDPTIIDFLDVYGYNKNYDFSRLDNPEELDKLVKNTLENRASWKDIEIDEANFSVKLAKKQRIDLGGIGKGYAVDCAYEKLSEVANNFIINAGGDIRVCGLNDKSEKWNIRLRTSDSNNDSLFVELEGGQAIASSGSWARKVKQFHHLIDPKTGKPTEKEYSTVFIKGNSCIEADSWATAVFVNAALVNSAKFGLEYMLNK